MSDLLNGRVAIVTGAGGGLGRSHALTLAGQGASVVVNDYGVDVQGVPTDPEAALAVVEEINVAGGNAIASGHNVADWQQAEQLVQTAIDAFGDLHILVNNAGIIRDRSLPKLTEQEWDGVLAVHLKGSGAMTHHAFAYWKEQANAGVIADRSVVVTTSVAGLSGNWGQANYASAKLGLVGLSAVAAIEGKAYGVRSNAISPAAKTRMSLAVPGAEETYAKETGDLAFDPMDPANVSAVVGWLAAERCPATRQIFHVAGDKLTVIAMPRPAHQLDAQGKAWTPELLDKALTGCLLEPMDVDEWGGFPEGFFRK